MNFRRFLVFPGGISNSSRFPVFPVAVDTLGPSVSSSLKITNHSLATHFLTSEINLLTHYANPILLISCLSNRNHQPCHVILHHLHPCYHPLRPLFFIPDSKPIFCKNSSHHRKLIPIGLSFTDYLTFY